MDSLIPSKSQSNRDVQKIVKNLRKVSMYTILYGTSLWASTTSMKAPWEGPLSSLAAMLQGPIATSISIISLVGAGISLMFFEVNKSVKWFLAIIVAISLITSAAGFLSKLGVSSVTL